MKKAITVLLVLMLVLASVSAVFAEEGEIDYSQWNSNSAYPSDVVNTNLFTPVKFLVDKKVIEGYEDGLFHEDWNVTRAEYIKMVIIATNNTGNLGRHGDSGFSDVEGHWAEEYIEAGVELKLINGYPDGSFQPDGNVSYAEVMAIFIRTKGITESQMSAYGKWPDNYARYADMYNMTGSVNVTDWNAPATRGDVARILYRNLPK